MWIFGNQSTLFNQTDVSFDHNVEVVSISNEVVPNVTEGRVISTLHIIDVQHPDDDGMYKCIGSNSNAGVTYTSIAMITVQVQGNQRI